MTLVLSLVAASMAAPLTYTDETSSRVSTTTVQSDQDKEFAIGDVDNDGDLDVVLGIAAGIFGRRQNILYLNVNGTLVEYSNLVPNFMIDTLSRRPFLEDIDGDGWLDLIVVNDELAPGYAGETHLWMNDHPGGVFMGFVQEDARLNGGGGDSCGASMVDFDEDGHIDLYSGNYPGSPQDTMYLNDGTGNFIDVTQSNVPVDSDYTTDVVVADLNGDGTLDISTGNHFDPSKVYYNNLDGSSTVGDFTAGNSVQVTRQNTRHHNATQPVDVDGDGDLDLYMANWLVDQDAVLINDGNDSEGRVMWTDTPLNGPVSRSETTKPESFDFDGDGRADMFVPGYEDATLLRNVGIDGTMEWIDWTPPAIGDHAAFSAGIFDLDGDGIDDIVLFGQDQEHVYMGAEAPVFNISGQTMPSTAAGPIVLEGEGVVGDRILQLSPLPQADYAAAIVRACGDVALAVGDANGTRRRSDRTTTGNEEFASLSPTGGFGFLVEIRTACADSDGDGDVDNVDFAAAAQCVANPTPSCVSLFDADLDGEITLADQAIVLADSNGRNTPATTRFTVEFLSR